MKILKFCISLLFVFVSGCASQLKQAPYSWDAADQLSQKQWEQHRGEKEYDKFNKEWLRFYSANFKDQKDKCYALSNDFEELVLIQNEIGEIQSVIPKRSTPKSECFAKVFLGKKYPKPPFAPFYHYVRILIKL